MATGNTIILIVNSLDKCTKFNAAIAKHVRVWRSSCPYFGNSIRYYFRPILFLQGYNFKWHAKLITDRPHIHKILFPWARPKVGKFIFKPDFDIKSSNWARARGKHMER